MNPVAGPIFRHVVALGIEGEKRRRLVALIAAHHDAGHDTVGAAELAEWLGWNPRTVHGLLERLQRDGYIATSRRTARSAPRHRRYRIAAEHIPAELRPQQTEAIA